MMHRVQIKANGHTYSVDLLNYPNVRAAYDHARNVIMNCEGIFEDENGLLDINSHGEYDHIHVTEVPDVPLPFLPTSVPAPDPDGDASGTVKRFDSGRLQYLGNPFTISGVGVHDFEGRCAYYLPVELNGLPWEQVLSREHANSLLTYYAESRQTPGMRYEIVMPAAYINFEEALEYLTDYVGPMLADKQKPGVEVGGLNTAKAFRDWRETDHE